MTVKKCYKCLEIKPISEFYSSKNMRDGHAYYCRACAREDSKLRYEKTKEAKKEYQRKNAIKIKERKHRKYMENLDKNREKGRIYNKKNKKEIREKNLLHKYGISLQDYASMLENQNYRCAICGVTETDFDKPLFVDHNHETGKIRGLLCPQCNIVLGAAKDNIFILLSATEYLEKFK